MEFVFPSTEATAESPELFRACEFIEDAIDKITTLHQQLTESQARCAELELATSLALDDQNQGKAAWTGHLEKALIGTGKAFILRTQADAVQGRSDYIRRRASERWLGDATIISHLDDYAQRLRDRADEIERGGSDAN